jgi:HEAT repeat protein
MCALQELGPLAVRGAKPEIIAGLNDPDLRARFSAAQAMVWLVPESPEAVAAYSKSLANTNNPLPTLLNLVNGESAWSRMPGTIPALTNWLHRPGQAYNGAIALGSCGSNATAAIPALIETLDHGVAGPFADDESRHWQTSADGIHKTRQDDKGMNHNRAMAAAALGKLGVGSPEVTAALVRGWNDHDAWVRANAAKAVGQLDEAMMNHLPELLAGMHDNDARALSEKLAALGKMGPNARDALDVLHKFAETEWLTKQLNGSNSEVVGMSVKDLSLAAKIDICLIDPKQGHLFLPELVLRIGTWWQPVECLVALKPLSNEVIQAVEPMLETTNTSDQSIAAYIILMHNPNHQASLDVLHRNREVGEMNARLLAARLLFESVRDTNGSCALIEEALKLPQSFVGQSATHLADIMGPAAQPAIPALKAALWHKDRYVRDGAGRVLRKLAPDEMPIRIDQ